VTAFTLGLLALALYLPPLTAVLHMAPLPGTLLAVAMGAALACMLWFEILKFGNRTWSRNHG